MSRLDIPSDDRTTNATISRRTALLWCLIWLAWLPMAVPMAASLATPGLPSARLVVSLFGLICFLVLYIAINWQSSLYLANPDPGAPRVTGVRLWAPLALLYGLCALLVALNGTTVWGGLFFYTVATAAGALPWRQAVGAILALILLMFLIGHAQGADAGTGVYALLLIAIISVTILGWMWAYTANRRARADREEIARLAAIAEERLRIARDLHDVLGHSLSLITLKSELAGRLLDQAPDRARAEIADVEQVARQALREVREAVSGYRQASLAGEWTSARSLLEAAGVTLRPESGIALDVPLPPAVEAVLGFALREGATNVVRHSRAHWCAVRVRQRADAVTLDVTNDGVSPRPDAPGASLGSAETTSGTPSPSTATSNGLRGLRERVLALGGTWEAGAVGADEFHLAISLPLGTAAQPALVSENERAPGLPNEGARRGTSGGIIPHPAL